MDHPDQQGVCSYCGKELGRKYTFSYGIPGIPRTYGCVRQYCKIKRRVVRKVKLTVRPLAAKLHKWCNRPT